MADNPTQPSPEVRAFAPLPKDIEEVSQKERGRPGYITANPYTYNSIKNFREVLKTNPTEAEKIIWEYLRNKKTGFKIRRQHIIDNYIPDFVCLSKKLIIEIDGKIHDFQKDKDLARTFDLNMKGYTIIRYSNEEVLRDPQAVADSIKQILEQITTTQK